MDISEDFRPIATKYAIVSFYEEDVHSLLGSVVCPSPISAISRAAALDPVK